MLKSSPCKSFKKYKAIFPPKCDCQPCHDKWEEENKSRKKINNVAEYHRALKNGGGI